MLYTDGADYLPGEAAGLVRSSDHLSHRGPTNPRLAAMGRDDWWEKQLFVWEQEWWDLKMFAWMLL